MRLWLEDKIEEARVRANQDRATGSRLGEDIYRARKGAFQDALVYLNRLDG